MLSWLASAKAHPVTTIVGLLGSIAAGCVKAPDWSSASISGQLAIVAMVAFPLIMGGAAADGSKT